MRRVSVALCTFNGAEYIERQLASIFAQRSYLLEVVIADDGSTDDTLDRVESAARAADATELVRILRGGGHGVTKNFERAMRACRGEIIVLSDQDDEWVAGRLETQLAAFDQDPGAMLVFGDAELVDRRGDALGSTLFQMLEVSETALSAVEAGNAFDQLLRRNLVTGATVAVRRSLLDAALPFPEAWVHDEWLAIIASGLARLSVIRQPLTRYRQHGGNEIGVTAPTLGNKIRRVLQPRGDRNLGLAVRSRLLAQRLEQLGAPSAVIAAARSKADFERFRAELPVNRLLRAVPVLLRIPSGEYARFASRGTMDIVRDLLQPAAPASEASSSTTTP